MIAKAGKAGLIRVKPEHQEEYVAPLSFRGAGVAREPGIQGRK